MIESVNLFSKGYMEGVCSTSLPKDKIIKKLKSLGMKQIDNGGEFCCIIYELL